MLNSHEKGLITPDNLVLLLARAEGVRIRDLNNDEVVDGLGKCFDVIILSLGIRTKPLPALAEKMIRFIRYHYAGLFVNDIELAFDLALVGKLNVDVSKHYQSFDLVFLTSVLNAYMAYRRELLMRPKQARKGQALLDAPDKVRLNKEEFHRTIIEFYCNFIEKKNVPPGHYFINTCFEYLESNGLFEIALDRKNEIFSQAKELADLRLREEALASRGNGRMKTASDIITSTVSGGLEQKRVAREIALNEIFAKWGEDDFNLTEELQKLMDK